MALLYVGGINESGECGMGSTSTSVNPPAVSTTAPSGIDRVLQMVVRLVLRQISIKIFGVQAPTILVTVVQQTNQLSSKWIFHQHIALLLPVVIESLMWR